jgi:hypothetical protein
VYIAVCGMGIGRGDQSARRDFSNGTKSMKVPSCLDVNTSSRRHVGMSAAKLLNYGRKRDRNIRKIE